MPAGEGDEEDATAVASMAALAAAKGPVYAKQLYEGASHRPPPLLRVHSVLGKRAN